MKFSGKFQKTQSVALRAVTETELPRVSLLAALLPLFPVPVPPPCLAHSDFNSFDYPLATHTYFHTLNP